jgi:predicted nucleic acid-binding protein
MKVIVDTSVWFLALRRRKENLSETEGLIVKELSELINETRVVMIGPIRQELLSGISKKKSFETLKQNLSFFEDFWVETKDFETAAKFFNECRKNGIQGSFTDFLICAIAYNHKLAIFSTDKDFDNYSKVLNLNLHKGRDE